MVPENFDRLKAILREMLLLDRADLDFGIYRIINLVREELEHFLDREIALQAESSFTSFLHRPLPPEELALLTDGVYAHLAAFFRRCYQSFPSPALRRYKPGCHLPYQGEEVKLLWASADQYYIPSDRCRDYRFRLPTGRHVRFTSTGESGARHFGKSDVGKERRFVLCAESPVAEKRGEVVIRFEYRTDHGGARQASLNEAAERAILGSLDQSWQRELTAPAPTGRSAQRTVLQKHLSDYTAKCSCESFIHKDLGSFLRGELDFFINSELTCLDELESGAVGTCIATAKVIRAVGLSIIELLEHLEDFQKRLWLKKKVAVRTDWWVTLDRVPMELYPEVAKNSAQQEAWRRLFAVDEIGGYREPPAVEFLKGNPFLVLDTACFSRSFTGKLVASFDDLDEATDGVVVNGDNLQALNLIAPRLSGEVSNIYIDPPYNTGDEAFLYKNSYRSSAWLSMMQERLAAGVQALSESGVLFISIGDEEQEHLATLLRQMYGKDRLFATLIWEKKKKGTFLSGKIARMKDYILCLAHPTAFAGLVGEVACGTETYPCVNAANPREVRRIQPGIVSRYREPKVTFKVGTVISAGNMNMRLLSDLVIENGLLATELAIEGNWRYSQETMEEFAARKELYITQDLYLRRMVHEPRYKRMKDLLPRVGSAGEGDFRAYDMNDLNRFGWGTNEDANDELHQILGSQYAASYPKPSKLLTLLLAASRHTEGYWLDYFAGSGTTGHAVINMNREDGRRRKFILVEAGEHFDTVLRPRIQKVIYSKDWSGGRPLSRSGSSHLVKCLRLESYEDVLENVQVPGYGVMQGAQRGGGAMPTDAPSPSRPSCDCFGNLSDLAPEAFADPFNCRMKISSGGEPGDTAVDLVETFNWLLGLRVRRIGERQSLEADFARDRSRVLRLDGAARPCAAGGGWTFQDVVGETADGAKVLVIWRTLKGEAGQDDLVLEQWLDSRGYGGDCGFDVIYVNGWCHCLEASAREVRCIEETFCRLLFDSDST